MWPQLSVLLISLSLIHGNGISIRQYSSEENSNESDNSVSSEEIGYYVDHQISSVTLTRDINEILSLYPNSVVEKFDQRVGEVRGTLFYTLGARIQSKFVFIGFIIKNKEKYQDYFMLLIRDFK